MKHVGSKGIYAYDRGGEYINLFGPLLDRHVITYHDLESVRILNYEGL